MELIKPGRRFDFLKWSRICSTVSGLVVLASIVLFFLVGPNWGIDFTGGTEIHLKFHQPIEIGEVRQAIEALGLSGDAVQQVNAPEDHEFMIRIQQATFGTEEITSEVRAALERAFGPDWLVDFRTDAQVGARITVEHKPPEVPIRTIQEALSDIEGVTVNESPDDNTFYVKLPGLPSLVQRTIATTLEGRDFEVLQVDSVGPKVGGDLRRQGFISMAATLGLILVYVAFRFDLTFAPGAVIALFHDVLVTIGVFVVLQMEVNLPMIGALLTIIGYSLNDTIVIYDRIRENMQRYRRTDLPKLINDSISETLSRTLNTSITTLLAVIAILLIGGPVIMPFGVALLIGVVVGTYSTVFVASPMILPMSRLKPKLVRLLVPPVEEDKANRPLMPKPGRPQ